MSPLAALTAIIMGSAVAITVGLGMVLAVYFILGAEHSRLAAEFPTLWRSFGLFAVLAVISVAGFIAVMKHRPWRWYAQAGIYAWITVITLVYWPAPQN